MTDKLRSYGVAQRVLMPYALHDSAQYANNRIEQSHDASRVRQRGMRAFKPPSQTQQFLDAYAAVSSLISVDTQLAFSITKISGEMRL